MNRTTFRWIIAALLICWTGLVLYGSLAPGDALPPSGWLAWLARIPHSDKLVHFGFYCGEVTLLLLLCNLRPWSKALTVAGVILLSGIIELIQPHVGRSKDLVDFAANTAGALTGTLLAYGLNRLFAKRLKAADNHSGQAGRSGE